MTDKQMDKFDLSKLAPKAREEVSEIKGNEHRLTTAQPIAEPEAATRVKANLYKDENLTVNAIGKVFGLNAKGRF